MRGLDLSTAADVYHLGYFTQGEWIDSENRVPGQSGNVDRRGLLASGLVGKAARLGLLPGERPSQLNYRRRIARTAALLGAIAFEMFATNTNPSRPEPNTVGVPEEQLETFQANVAGVSAAGQRPKLRFWQRLGVVGPDEQRGRRFPALPRIGAKGTGLARPHGAGILRSVLGNEVQFPGRSAVAALLGGGLGGKGTGRIQRLLDLCRRVAGRTGGQRPLAGDLRAVLCSAAATEGPPRLGAVASADDLP